MTALAELRGPQTDDPQIFRRAAAFCRLRRDVPSAARHDRDVVAERRAIFRQRRGQLGRRADIGNVELVEDQNPHEILIIAVLDGAEWPHEQPVQVISHVAVDSLLRRVDDGFVFVEARIQQRRYAAEFCEGGKEIVV